MIRPVAGGGVQTYSKDCAETDEMLRVSIKQLSTLHSPLFTLLKHPCFTLE